MDVVYQGSVRPAHDGDAQGLVGTRDFHMGDLAFQDGKSGDSCKGKKEKRKKHLFYGLLVRGMGKSNFYIGVNLLSCAQE